MGSVIDLFVVVLFSNLAGQGPTTDGRIKPEIIATGVDVPAAGLKCTSTDFSGTAAAASVVAGMASLVRQYFVDGTLPLASQGRLVPYSQVS
jgi:subtilisin family serine protease